MTVDRTRLIPLTQGKFAIVDAEDYDRLSRHKWHAVKDGGTFSAAQTRIGFERHRLHLGLFEDPIDAAVTYDRKAIELFGEFTCLDFPRLVEFRKFVEKLFPAA